MMSSDLIRQISAVAQQLRREGKAVNLALVRARMPSTDPAKLFTAFQQWRNQPQSDVVETTAELSSVTSTSPATVSQSELQKLQQDVSRLEAKLDLIITLLQKDTANVGR